MVHNVIGFGKVGSICSFRPAFDANHGGETNHIEMLPNAAECCCSPSFDDGLLGIAWFIKAWVHRDRWILVCKVENHEGGFRPNA